MILARIEQINSEVRLLRLVPVESERLFKVYILLIFVSVFLLVDQSNCTFSLAEFVNLSPILTDSICSFFLGKLVGPTISPFLSGALSICKSRVV